MQPYAMARGRAQAHARSGDAVAIASNMGRVEPSTRPSRSSRWPYADWAAKDFEAFTAAIAGAVVGRGEA